MIVDAIAFYSGAALIGVAWGCSELADAVDRHQEASSAAAVHRRQDLAFSDLLILRRGARDHGEPFA